MLIWTQVQTGRPDYLWMEEFGETLLSSVYFSSLFALKFLKKKKKERKKKGRECDQAGE